MNHHTREVLGRLTRWILLACCVVAGGIAVLAVITGLRPTLVAARGWSVMPDVVGSTRGYLRLALFTRPRLRQGAGGFYWRAPDGKLREMYIGRGGVSFLRLPEEVEPGRHTISSVPNPYGPHGPGTRHIMAHLLRRPAEVILFDARIVLALDDDGRLADDVRQQWPKTAKSAPLLRVAESGTLVYLLPLPLADYERAREVLQRAPAAAVITASTDWQTPVTPDDVLDMMKNVRNSLGKWPLLITEDVTLAKRVAQAHRPVILVGEHPLLPRPGLVFARWSAVLEHLDRR